MTQELLKAYIYYRKKGKTPKEAMWCARALLCGCWLSDFEDELEKRL